MDYEIKNIRRVDKGIVKASFDVRIYDFLTRDWTLFERNGERWTSPPSQAYEDKDGKTRYFSYIRIEDKEKYHKFNDWLLRKVTAALDEGV
jgi:hypothetical protein